MILHAIPKRIISALEYSCFCACFFYWLFYSIFRVKGIPVLFSGIAVNSISCGVLVSIVLLFNALFFSRLLFELATKTDTLRVRVTHYLFRRFLPIFLILFVISFATGGRFDYASYKLQWAMIIKGANPWGFVEGGMVNAYGYVFNFLAVFYSVYSLLPKFLIVFLLFLFCSQLIPKSHMQSRDLILFLCVNPFTISTIPVYGFSDGLCALLLGLALIERSNKGLGASFKSGLYLSLSILSKFYSAVALPFFVVCSLDFKLLRSFVKGFLFASAVTILVSYFLWGDSIFTPLLFAKSRDPSFLTLWKYIRHPELRTVIFSTISVLAVAWASLKKQLSCSLRTAAALSIVFGSYYLGHQQFYLGILVALTVYLSEISGSESVQVKNSLLRSFALLLGWLIFVQTGFELFDEFKPLGFQELLPFFSFLNSTILLASGLFWLSIKPTRDIEKASLV